MAEEPAVTPSPARLFHDGEWKYRGYHDCPSLCRLRIYEPTISAEPLIVIFTELRENKGTSVTNRIEHLATVVWRWLERPARAMTVIEHYQPHGVFARTSKGEQWQFKEEFDFVEMSHTTDERFEKPCWKPSTRATIERLIGQLFPQG